MFDLGFWELFAIFGSFASILSLIILRISRWSPLIHIAYALFIVAIVLGFVTYKEGVQQQLSELQKIKRIERQADSLLTPLDLSTAGLKAGYALSVLAFFEKHRQLYPETYKRAKVLCDNAGCTKVGRQEGNDSLGHFSRMQDVSSAMKELARGVSSLEGQ